MTTVSITHRTTYRYATPVRFGPHRLMLRPRDSHDLRLLSATLATTPTATVRWKHDVFGNSIAVAAFDDASEVLEIISRIRIAHYPADPPDVAALIEPYAQTHPFAYPAEEAEDLAPVLRRHDPDPDRRVDTWAKRFLNPAGPTSTADLLVRMTQTIQAEFLYLARNAEGTNPAPATLARGSGTCRDFALLMMEACRSLGFAARFVSGYLYDPALVDSASPMIGGGSTHAWCSIFLPGAGWVEFDPTNGLVAGRNLVRIAVTRTPEQAVPISGAWFGAPEQFVGLDVDVQVQVGEETTAPLAA